MSQIQEQPKPKTIVDHMLTALASSIRGVPVEVGNAAKPLRTYVLSTYRIWRERKLLATLDHSGALNDDASPLLPFIATPVNAPSSMFYQAHTFGTFNIYTVKIPPQQLVTPSTEDVLSALAAFESRSDIYLHCLEDYSVDYPHSMLCRRCTQRDRRYLKNTTLRQKRYIKGRLPLKMVQCPHLSRRDQIVIILNNGGPYAHWLYTHLMALKLKASPSANKLKVSVDSFRELEKALSAMSVSAHALGASAGAVAELTARTFGKLGEKFQESAKKAVELQAAINSMQLKGGR